MLGNTLGYVIHSSKMPQDVVKTPDFPLCYAHFASSIWNFLISKDVPMMHYHLKRVAESFQRITSCCFLLFALLPLYSRNKAHWTMTLSESQKQESQGLRWSLTTGDSWLLWGLYCSKEQLKLKLQYSNLKPFYVPRYRENVKKIATQNKHISFEIHYSKIK